MLKSTTPPALAVRGTVAVCRELGIPGWFLERVIREEGWTIARVGNARAWTDADIERLRRALAARAARQAARRRSSWTSLLDPDDLAVDLAAEDEHDERDEVRS
jgi:hypothetical protein